MKRGPTFVRPVAFMWRGADRPSEDNWRSAMGAMRIICSECGEKLRVPVESLPNGVAIHVRETVERHVLDVHDSQGEYRVLDLD